MMCGVTDDVNADMEYELGWQADDLMILLFLSQKNLLLD